MAGKLYLQRIGAGEKNNATANSVPGHMRNLYSQGLGRIPGSLREVRNELLAQLEEISPSERSESALTLATKVSHVAVTPAPIVVPAPAPVVTKEVARALPYKNVADRVSKEFERARGAALAVISTGAALPNSGCWAYYRDNQIAIINGIAAADLRKAELADLVTIADYAFFDKPQQRHMFIGQCLVAKDIMIAHELGIEIPAERINYFRGFYRLGDKSDKFSHVFTREDMARLVEKGASFLAVRNFDAVSDLSTAIKNAATLDLDPYERWEQVMNFDAEVKHVVGSDGPFGLHRDYSDYPSRTGATKRDVYESLISR